jgi:hypothetical protein
MTGPPDDQAAEVSVREPGRSVCRVFLPLEVAEACHGVPASLGALPASGRQKPRTGAQPPNFQDGHQGLHWQTMFTCPSGDRLTQTCTTRPTASYRREHWAK